MSTRSHEPSPFPRTDLRELYLQLMAQGMKNSQACRVVGVHPRPVCVGDTGERSGKAIQPATTHRFKCPANRFRRGTY